MQTIRRAKLAGKRVLVRVDFNVPMQNGKITDDSRIRESIPTIKELIKKNARIILISHLGRPNGDIVENLRLKPVAKRLSKLLKREIKYAHDCVGREAEDKTEKLKQKEILLLENVRFHKEEEKNDDEFAKQLAKLAEIYVNDAFGCSHRKHASVHAITKYLPSYAGILLEKEINILSNLMKKPKKPFVVILGGAKVSDKIRAISNLAQKADKILIGGAMAFTFLKAQGKNTGKNRLDATALKFARTMLNKYANKIILPLDFILDNKKESSSDNIPEDCKGYDIGSKTLKIFKKEISKAKTVFWNGPLGLIEQKPFERGTESIAKAISKLHATTIAGGGETCEIIHKLKLEKKFTHVSTGGGALIEFIEGKKLPGIEALT